jgi:hypothetical protein
MDYKLGDKKVHPYGGEKEGYTIVVAVFNKETEEYDLLESFEDLEDLKEFIEAEEPSEDILFFAVEDGWGEYLSRDEIEETISDSGRTVLWSEYITEEQINKRKEVSRKIVELLEENNINTSDLIVSDGCVYQGYGECANYIQATYAWCSSSMSC